MNDDLQDEYDEHPGLEAQWTLSLDRLHGCAEHASSSLTPWLTRVLAG
jgi:hypothetical protein